MEKYKVAARCMTYNHASYIEDALHGFAMQNTTFPVVCVIVDDASTDGEPEILHRWVDENLIKGECMTDLWCEMPYGQLAVGSLKSNVNITFVVVLLADNHTQKGLSAKKMEYITEWIDNSKYIALCEGDDYWIDPMKLQRQVDFMETHLDYSMCFHNAIILNTSSNDIKPFAHYREGELSAHDAIHNWFIPTASMFFRRELQKNPSWFVKIYSGDYPLILKSLAAGKIWGFAKYMSVYRQNWSGTSVSAIMQSQKKMHYEHHKKLLESFNKGTDYRFNTEVTSRLKYLDEEIKFYSIQESGKKWKYITVMPSFLEKVKIKIGLSMKKWFFPSE